MGDRMLFGLQIFCMLGHIFRHISRVLWLCGGISLYHGLTIALFLLIADVKPVFACSCVPDILRENLATGEADVVKKAVGKLFKNSAAIFYGRVTALRESFESRSSPQFGAVATITEFLVRNSWKGARTEKISLLQNADTCQLDLEFGRYYLIFTDQDKNGSLSVSICSIYFEESSIPHSVLVELEAIAKSKIFGPPGLSHEDDVVVEATDGRHIPITE